VVSPSAPPPPASVAEWLRSIDMAKYERAFVKHGFDDLEFIVSLRQTLNSSKVPFIMNFINALATLAQRRAYEN
jgi:SAM domain (Sterile alpha motif)